MLKSKLKRLLCVVLSVMMVVPTLLSGCSTVKTPKSEKEIIADIVANDSYFSNYGLKISEYSILSRLTSTERMTDEIEVQVQAECDSFTYKAEYSLRYLLYDDGWVLDDDIGCQSSYAAKNTVSQSEADSIAKQNYGTVEFISLDVGTNSSTFYYTTNVSEGYVLEEKLVTIQYSFRPSSGWTYKISDSNTGNITWDITGEWYYEDDDNNIWVRVESIDDTAITCEYKISLRESRWSLNEESDGVVALEYGWYQKANYNLASPYEIYFRIPNIRDERYYSMWIYSSTGLSYRGYKLSRK